MTTNRDVYETDILIIGSGGAGLRAAIEAAKIAKVTIVSKGPFARGGASVLAGADVMLDGKSLSDLGFEGNPRDSQEQWFDDILAEGFYLNNQDLVEAYVLNAPKRVKELLDWGMKTNPSRTDTRAVITTGAEILRVLRQQVKESGAKAIEYVMVTDLLLNDDVVCGAIGVDSHTGNVIVFKCKAIILATGGWHELYSFNTGSNELTGDGPAIAYRAGAKLTNMEMVTFCPNVILHPPAYRGTVFLYNLLPGQLLNSHGDAFLQWESPEIVKIVQTSEWNKLLLSQASWREIMGGRGTPHGGVYYSLRNVPANLWEVLESRPSWKGWKFQGKDFSELIRKMKDGYAVEVGPAAHYFEGGIKIDDECKTTIPGLFAAGECTGELFGANRVSAATTEMLVEGAIAGRSATVFVQNTGIRTCSQEQIRNLRVDLYQPLERTTGVRPGEIKTSIQKAAYQHLGAIRDKTGLEEVLKEARAYQEALAEVHAPKRKQHNREWIEALEARNLVELLGLVSLAALEREESRGVHYRRDCPDVDNNRWLRNVVIHQENGQISITKEPVVAACAEALKGIISYKESIQQAIRMLGPE